MRTHRLFSATLFLFLSLFALAVPGASAGNLLPGDSGYELGLGYFRRPWFNGTMNLELREGEDAPQGRGYAYGISSPGQAIGLSGERMALRKNVPYVLSLWVRASRPQRIRMATVHEGWKDTQFHPFEATPQWKQVVLPFTVGFDAIYWLLLEYTNEGTEPLEVCLDAVQLEEGTQPGPFANQDDLLTVGEVLGGNTGVCFVGEPMQARLGALKAAGETRDCGYRLTVTNYRGETVFSREKQCLWEEGRFLEALPLPSDLPGLYVVRIQWLDTTTGTEVSRMERSYAVVRPPLPEDPEVEPYMGVNSAIFDALRRVGPKWVEFSLWWRSLMPSENQVDYDDFLKRIRHAKAQGYRVKLSLVHLPASPEWAHRPEEVAEAKAWGLTPSMGFFGTEEALAKLSSAFEELIRRAGNDVDLLEIGGEDELISGSEPYYRRKYPQDVIHGIVHGPVCRDLARITTVYLQAARRARPDIPIAAGRPSGGSAAYPDFEFSRMVLEKVEGEFQFFPMDCYSFRMRYLNEANMPNIGSPNLEFPGVFQRANRMTHTYLQGQKPFVSEYGFAIDNRLSADHPLQQEECRRMLAAALTAKLLGSPYFFWFNTFGCVEDKVFDYGMWHVDQPMLLIPAMSQLCRVVEGVHQYDSRLGTPEGNLKMGVFGQRNQAVLAIWTEFRDNPLQLPLPQGTRHLDFLGNPLPDLPQDEAVATKLPQYFVLEGNGAYALLKEAMEKAEDRNMNLTAALHLGAGRQATLELKSTEPGSNAAARAILTFPDGSTVAAEKPEGTPFPWRLPVELAPNAERAELTLEDARGMTAKRSLAFPAQRLAEGENPLALFGEQRSEILPPDPWIRWDGKEDLGGTIHATVSKDSLVLTAEIQDDFHCNQREGTQIWDGDCFQFALVPEPVLQTEGNGENYGPHDVEIALALTPQGPQIAVYSGAAQLPPLAAGRDFQVRRDETAKVTRYQISLPRASLGLQRHGQYFRFCAVVMDDDEGSGQSYFYQLSPGITGAKNVALMPLFQMP
ncbi:MAG: hypothetical protein ACI4Q0_07660 [Oligosphaeraceae bacterium]